MAALSAGAAVAVAVALALSALSWRRRDRRGAIPFAAMMGVNAVWVAAFAVELGTTAAAAALPWFRVRMAVLVFVPAAWFLFAVEHGGYRKTLSRRLVAATCAVPAAAALLTLTNGSHGLVWSSPAMVTRGSFRLLTVDYAAVWWASVGFSYLLIAAGVVLIAGVAAGSSGLYRKQSLLVLVASVPPAVANVVYYADLSPVPALDLTPFAFIVEGVVVFWALFGYRLFDRVPVARSAVVDTMDDPVVAVDGEGYVVDLNAAAEVLSTEETPNGRQFEAAFPTIAAAVDFDASAADGEVVVRQEGRDRYFEPRVTPLSRRDGAVVVLRDVTGRRERERSLEAIQDASRDLMRATTPEAVAERTVEAASEVLGLEYVSVHLLEDDRLVPVAHTNALHELYDPVPSYAVGEGLQGTAFQRGEQQVVENVHEETDTGLKDDSVPIRGVALFPLGEYGVLGAGSRSALAADDETVRVASVLAANATAALARAEREVDLKRQNERLDEFTGIVSHDLRNPLTVADGYLDVARETGDESAFDEVDEALDRMDRLVDDLLELARTGREVTDPDPVRLADVAAAAWAGIDSRDAAFDVAAGDAVVLADRSRLRRLLENLFRNAVEHAAASRSGATPERTDAGADEPLYRSAAGGSAGDAGTPAPQVTVTVGTLGRIRSGGSSDESPPTGFYVADDGPGIPSEERDRVFERGYTTDDDGTGIGLAIVREVAEAHDWSTAVIEGADGGARFEFTDAEFR